MTDSVEIDLDTTGDEEHNRENDWTTDGKGLYTEGDKQHPEALFSEDDESVEDFDYGPESDESNIVEEEDNPMDDEDSYGGGNG